MRWMWIKSVFVRVGTIMPWMISALEWWGCFDFNRIRIARTMQIMWIYKRTGIAFQPWVTLLSSRTWFVQHNVRKHITSSTRPWFWFSVNMPFIFPSHSIHIVNKKGADLTYFLRAVIIYENSTKRDWNGQSWQIVQNTHNTELFLYRRDLENMSPYCRNVHVGLTTPCNYIARGFY